MSTIHTGREQPLRNARMVGEDPRCTKCLERLADEMLNQCSSGGASHWPVSSAISGGRSAASGGDFARSRSGSEFTTSSFVQRSSGPAAASERYSESMRQTLEVAYENFWFDQECESLVLASNRKKKELQDFLDSRGRLLSSGEAETSGGDPGAVARSDGDLQVLRVVADFLPTSSYFDVGRGRGGGHVESISDKVSICHLDSTDRLRLVGTLRSRTGREVAFPLVQAASSVGDVLAAVRVAAKIEQLHSVPSSSQQSFAVWFVKNQCRPMGPWRYVIYGEEIDVGRLNLALGYLLQKRPILASQLSSSTSMVDFLASAVPMAAAVAEQDGVALGSEWKRRWVRLERPPRTDKICKYEQVRVEKFEHDLSKVRELELRLRGRKFNSESHEQFQIRAKQEPGQHFPIAVTVAQLSTSIGNSVWKLRNSNRTFVIMQVGRRLHYCEGEWRGLILPLTDAQFRPHGTQQPQALWFAECTSVDPSISALNSTSSPSISRARRLVWLWPEGIDTLGVLYQDGEASKDSSRPRPGSSTSPQGEKIIRAQRISAAPSGGVVDAGGLFSFVFVQAAHSHADDHSGRLIAEDLFGFYHKLLSSRELAAAELGPVDEGMAELERRLCKTLTLEDGNSSSRCSLRGRDFLVDNGSPALVHQLRFGPLVVRTLQELAGMYRTTLESLLIGSSGFFFSPTNISQYCVDVRTIEIVHVSRSELWSSSVFLTIRQRQPQQAELLHEYIGRVVHGPLPQNSRSPCRRGGSQLLPRDVDLHALYQPAR